MVIWYNILFGYMCIYCISVVNIMWLMCSRYWNFKTTEVSGNPKKVKSPQGRNRVLWRLCNPSLVSSVVTSISKCSKLIYWELSSSVSCNSYSSRKKKRQNSSINRIKIWLTKKELKICQLLGNFFDLKIFKYATILSDDVKR